MIGTPRGVRNVGGVVAALVVALGMAGPPATADAGKRPKTGFEKRNGESWTTHEEELDFLATVDRLSDGIEVATIATTPGRRPIHLARLGSPRPRTPADARREPTLLFVCSQHGNEPAGREACLKLLRDLALTDDSSLERLLHDVTVLFIPTANPDGRAANTRGNSQGTDVNRDHLNLQTIEAQAIARVVRDWEPDVVLDLHEYGPSLPVVYDDEILYLWPRNLNVDDKVHDLAQKLAFDYVAKGAEDAGYSADEYGQYEVADQDVFQIAGGPDEGIARNAMGLRHALGILIESAVTADPRNGPQEATSQAEVNLRRVDSHMAVSRAALDFMADLGERAMTVTDGARDRKTEEGAERSAPVYFGGADNDPPEEDEIQDPPPCGYELSAKQLAQTRATMALLDISFRRISKGAFVSMAQPGEPVIPLLLDERADRHAVEATPIMECREARAA